MVSYAHPTCPILYLVGRVWKPVLQSEQLVSYSSEHDHKQ